MEGLCEWLNLIQRAYLEYSLGDPVKAKKTCLATIEILNNFQQLPKELSIFTLKVYDELKNGVSISDQIGWLSLKSLGFCYYPKLTFGTLNSFDDKFTGKFIEDNESIHQLPLNIQAGFKSVASSNWSCSQNDLSNLYQDLLPNCSFVSSLLSICDPKLIDLISPKISSESYRVLLLFNGSWRIINIDSTLPILDIDRSIYIKSYNSKILWPALIEKAYLKVMGKGYNFDGSNMCNDTYMLTGWIPETIKIKHILPSNFKELWQLKMQKQLLIGIGTGKLSAGLSLNLGLISNHDYVIEDFNCEDLELTLKNPWVEGNDIKNRYITVRLDIGFTHIYLNWNPDRFKHETRLNLISTPCELIRNQSQIKLTVAKRGTVNLLVEQHLNAQECCTKVEIYKTENGEKIMFPNQYAIVGNNLPSSNNRLQLIKLELEARSYTVVLSTSIRTTITLVAFSNGVIELSKSRNLLKNSTLSKGYFNNGGNWALTSYLNNPQYDLQVDESGEVGIVVFSNTLVNFHVFHAEEAVGKGIKSFNKSKLLFNENYNPGHQGYKLKLGKGNYKLVISSYEVCSEEYEVIINYDGNKESLRLTKISSHLGLFNQKVDFDWNNLNRKKVFFKISNHDTRVTIHLHLPMSSQITSSYALSLRGSIFKSSGEPVVINEEWNNSIYGVFVECVLHTPGEYIILVERFEAGNGNFVLELGSNKKIEIDRKTST